jgi:hypothetical protein
MIQLEMLHLMMLEMMNLNQQNVMDHILLFVSSVTYLADRGCTPSSACDALISHGKCGCILIMNKTSIENIDEKDI